MVRFAIVGSGWRALFYIRVARALPGSLEVTALRVRNEEKKAFIEDNYGVKAVLSDEELIDTSPSFVVIAVSKDDMFKVSRAYLERGIPVIAETPGAAEEKEIREALSYEPRVSYQIAEQYFLRPRYSALIKLATSGLIGRPVGVYCSIAHDYHGLSMIRKLLGKEEHPVKVSCNTVLDKVPAGFGRYNESVPEESTCTASRTIALYSFPTGEYALHDFSSYEYHCPVRRFSYRIEGERGEIRDGRVWYYDEKGAFHQAELEEEVVEAERDDFYPVLRRVEVVKRITCGGITLFENQLPDAVLSEDEYAIALLLLGKATYPAREGLMDSLISLW